MRKVTRNVNRLRSLSIEIEKTINEISQAFTNEIFKLRYNCRLVTLVKGNTGKIFKFYKKFFGAKIWNSLPYRIESSHSLKSLKIYLKTGTETGTNTRKSFVISQKAINIYIFIYI